MLEAFLLLLQAAAGAPPERIDLALPVATTGCTGPTGDEIVVCGGKANPYRLEKLDPGREATPIPKAEIGLLGGRAALAAEAAQLSGALQSNRLMARIRLPF